MMFLKPTTEKDNERVSCKATTKLATLDIFCMELTGDFKFQISSNHFVSILIRMKNKR